MLRKSLLSAATIALVSFGAVSAHAANIVDTAAKAGQFEIVMPALKAAGLVDTLKGAGPFTVFAPTDEAFKKLPAGIVENLLKPENKDQLIKILTYHVVPGKTTSDSIFGKKLQVTTVHGSPLPIDATKGGVSVKGAQVISDDVMADNGVIHVIDTIVLPN